MKLHGSAKTKITKDRNGKNVPCLEITEVLLVYSNTANNDSSQDSRILYIFVSNKLFGQLLDTSFENFIFLKIFNSEFS